MWRMTRHGRAHLAPAGTMWRYLGYLVENMIVGVA